LNADLRLQPNRAIAAQTYNRDPFRIRNFWKGASTVKSHGNNATLLDAALNPNAETASQQGSSRDDSEERRENIAIAAYYNAERRGFKEGGEMEDWLEAEKQIDGRTSEKGERGEASIRQAGAGNDAHSASAAGDGPERPDFPDLARAGVEHIEPHDVTEWAKRLDVPSSRLREAIKRVGPLVKDVKKFLGAHAN
jgi:hypothetical protein